MNNKLKNMNAHWKKYKFYFNTTMLNRSSQFKK